MSGNHVITGFHAAEEVLRALEARAGKACATGKVSAAQGVRLVFSKEGPRVKQLLALAATLGVSCEKAAPADLDALTAALPPELRDHRGLVLLLDTSAEEAAGLSEAGRISTLDALLSAVRGADSPRLIVVLDSVTDPHNVGAVLRSADQFAVSAVIVPESRSAKGGAGETEGVVARSSAGASAWIPLVRTPNLVRAVSALKEAGFWVYGAEAGGSPAADTAFPDKTVLVMGSEGSGIARLLRETCDGFVSIPTAGHIDSLNVSVACGILLYEFRRQKGFGASPESRAMKNHYL